jgi:hypothetical protein
VKLILSRWKQPVAAQFGVAGGRKKGSSFEDLNELAKQVEDVGAALGGADFGDMDMNAMLREAMNDPAYKQMMAESGMSEAEIMQGMEDAMKLFENPEALAAEVQKNMESLQDGGGIDSILENSDAILEQWEQMGVMTKEQIEELRSDPDKLAAQIKEAFAEISNIFSDPEKIQEMQKFLDPENLKQQLGGIDLESMFDNDEMLEEARLQLMDPSNPLASMLGDSAEVQEMLSDPAKFKDAMKEGIGALGGGGILGAGAVGGEL